MSEPRPNLLTIDGVAQRLGVPVRHVRRLVAERRIPYIKWGSKLHFDPIEIDAWVDQHRRPPHNGEHVASASSTTRRTTLVRSASAEQLALESS
jgi:excisionase family DNA binding protein